MSRGNMVRNYRKEALLRSTVSKGKVQILTTVAPYVTEEEQQLLDQKVKDKIFEDSKVRACWPVSTFCGWPWQLRASVRPLRTRRRYSSPWASGRPPRAPPTTPAPMLCGRQIGASPFEEADLVAEVGSNELLGRMTMSVLDIVKEFPVHKAAESPDTGVPMEIMSQVVDGSFAKGKVGLVCRVTAENVVLVKELQELLRAGQARLAGWRIWSRPMVRAQSPPQTPAPPPAGV